MPIAWPRSLVSHTSATVPAPTACTAAAAPPLSTRITINMDIDVDSAARICQTTSSVNDAMYTVRRPAVSLKDDHHSGNIDMASMYSATDRLAMKAVV